MSSNLPTFSKAELDAMETAVRDALIFLEQIEDFFANRHDIKNGKKYQMFMKIARIRGDLKYLQFKVNQALEGMREECKAT
jgi:histone deacetylase complex regulatory component SIN3